MKIGVRSREASSERVSIVMVLHKLLIGDLINGHIGVETTLQPLKSSGRGEKKGKDR